ncbi:MAG: type II toxin-antitoxin system PemK/MazF family toxin [Spirochaetota bacterium]|nr:type II toxin-antitoxin system PemK/MazF family toxin [Spirochaetota bacterium]
MDKLLFGDIVLIKFPFTNYQKYKKRPALILLDTEDSDIIICRITSKIYDTEFDLKINNWKECGLKLASVIRLHKIASVEKDLVELKIGSINKILKQKLKDKFRKII